MRYLLQKSDTDPLWWVVTDTEAQIVCRFREGAFNDTQQFTVLNDATAKESPATLASYAQGIAAWLRANHYELLFTSPTEIAEMVRQDLGDQIREQRELRGWSVEHLAQLTGLSTNHIRRIEAGKYAVTVDNLAMISNAFDMVIGFIES